MNQTLDSKKVRYPATDAMALARILRDTLSPFCERIAIAGSLRRKRATVGDIELLYIPNMGERRSGFFDTEHYSQADEKINQMLSVRQLLKRPNINGDFTWGEKNKLALHPFTGIPIDFFATTSENWWVSLVVRTGSVENNLKLTTGAIKRGGSLVAYGCGVRWRDGTITPATSEQHVFEMCGVPFKEPQFR